MTVLPSKSKKDAAFVDMRKFIPNLTISSLSSATNQIRRKSWAPQAPLGF